MDINDGVPDKHRISSRKTMATEKDDGENVIRRKSSRKTTKSPSPAPEASKRPIAGPKAVTVDKDSYDEVGLRLPERLFATDRFPSERVNMYSTVDLLLLWIPDMDILLGSPFGGLYQMPARRLYTGKVVHSMMTRQLVTRKKYEMWPVFGGA
ncbi:unnamed protein product [Brassica rapa]|uniref:Uncharacterized protein n=1 Tax=Brassica campestris TaxID=3711 RepID=A0A3P6BAL6_BRACM|nr:unnamed protein product [Brassica rapa]VDC93501.1 unnamed protein product [Brassica rapa]